MKQSSIKLVDLSLMNKLPKESCKMGIRSMRSTKPVQKYNEYVKASYKHTSRHNNTNDRPKEGLLPQVDLGGLFGLPTPSPSSPRGSKRLERVIGG